MPLPALHCRFAQAIVKMRNAEVWGVAALSERHAGWQYLRHTFYDARLPDLSLRGGRRPTWQSRAGSCNFAGSTLLSGRDLRDCHVASLLAMTHQEAWRRKRYTAPNWCCFCRFADGRGMPRPYHEWPRMTQYRRKKPAQGGPAPVGDIFRIRQGGSGAYSTRRQGAPGLLRRRRPRAAERAGRLRCSRSPARERSA